MTCHWMVSLQVNCIGFSAQPGPLPLGLELDQGRPEKQREGGPGLPTKARGELATHTLSSRYDVKAAQKVYLLEHGNILPTAFSPLAQLAPSAPTSLLVPPNPSCPEPKSLPGPASTPLLQPQPGSWPPPPGMREHEFGQAPWG